MTREEDRRLRRNLTVEYYEFKRIMYVLYRLDVLTHDECSSMSIKAYNKLWDKHMLGGRSGDSV